MNLTCSKNIKENIFNNEVVIIKSGNNIYCLPVSSIKKKIETKPFFVFQLSQTYLKEDGSVINSLLLKQTKHEQQVLLLGKKPNYFGVKYDFISAFNKGRNTFELSKPESKLLFRNKEENSIPSVIYTSKAISRKSLIPGQSIPENIVIKDEFSYEPIEKIVNEIIPVSNNMKKCINSTDTYQNEFKFDDNLIMMFVENKESFVYCFSLDELKEIIQVYINNTTKKELRNGNIAFKLYYFEKWIDITILESLLNDKVNTIMLVRADGDTDYYIPVKSSRKKIFNDEKTGLSDQFSSPFEIKQTEFHDEGEYRYRKLKHYFSDANQTQTTTGNVQIIEWIMYKRSSPGHIIRKSYHDEPAYTEFDIEGRKIKEEYIYDDEIKGKVSFYENGNKKREEWFQDNIMLERENGLPNVIEYYNNENGIIKTEEWRDENEKYSRRPNDLPNHIEYYENKNKIVKKECWFDKDDTSFFERKNGFPNEIEYYESKLIKSEKWINEYGEPIKRPNDLPNVIEYYENENKIIKAEKWVNENGYLFLKDDGSPSMIEYYENKNKIIKTEKWYNNRLLNREGDFPSIIEYYENPHNKKKEEWYSNNRLYRFYYLEPAVIEYDVDGITIKKQMWYSHGTLFKENEGQQINENEENDIHRYYGRI